MCKVIAICNQKGGVSKTTTTVNLGVGMVREGKRVLVIDADPQGNLSQSLGIENPDELEIALPTIMEQIIMDEEFEVSEGIIHHVEGIDLMPCNIDLSGVDVSLVNAMSREFVMKTYVDCMREYYDYIQRYIWLARLNDNLLGMVDKKKLGFIQGVSLSVLSDKEQEMVYDAICRYEKKLSTVQANTIKQLSVDGKLDEETLERYLFSVERHSKKKDITLKNERLAEYFEEETTEDEMMDVIFELLEKWKQKRGSEENE